MSIDPNDLRAGLAARSRGSAALSPLYESISASYFTLRRGLAALAFAFPILLVSWVGPDELQASISAYYHYSGPGGVEYGAGTMRDVFVGVLWAVGAFLFFYKGYSPKEDWALNIAGIAAVLVALCPMDWPVRPAAGPSMTAIVHTGASVAFFLATAYVCLLRPGDTLELLHDAGRRRRFKRTYGLLGTLMVVIPLTVVALHFLMPGPADRSPWVLAIEVTGIYVFSAFWLAKSREIAAIERQPDPA